MESPSKSEANTVQPLLPGKLQVDEATTTTTGRDGRRSHKKGSRKRRSSASLTSYFEAESDAGSPGSAPVVPPQEHYRSGASLPAISSISHPSTSRDHSQFMSHGSTNDDLGYHWTSRLQEVLRLPLKVRLESVSPIIASDSEKDDGDVQPGAKEGRSSAQIVSAQINSAPIVSAQMNSFWSMWATQSRQLMPKGWHQLTASDLACAVATILSAAIVILTSLVLLSPAVPPMRAEVTVAGAFGSVTGFGLLAAGRHVYAFLGVPFAEPLLDKARFQKAMPRQPTSVDGQRPGPTCYQEGAAATDVSENCLHLNIWTPEATCDTTRQPSCANRTVLFFLHGGYFQAGSNRDYPLDGSYLSALGDVVVVVPNYRLGALGFLYNGGPEAPGNAGLQDQLLALEWTRAHIGSFAGNGSDVVAMGHGAGAGSIGLHMFSSAAEDKGGRHGNNAGVISWPPAPHQSHPDERQPVHPVQCGHEDGIECLLDADAKSMYSNVLLPRFFPSFTEMMPYSPFEMRHFFRLTGVNVLLGHMEDEAPYLMSHLQKKGVVEGPALDRMAPNLLQYLGFNDSSSVVITHYYTNGLAGNASHWAGDLLTDVLVVCPVRHFADYLITSGNNSVYRYLLLRRRRPTTSDSASHELEDDSPSPPERPHRLYALGLVFGDPLRENNSDVEEQALSRRMIALWTDFAKSGTVPADMGETIFNYTIAISSAPNTDRSPFEFRKTQCDFLKDHYL
ncbi:hypothetical protein HPB50_001521 [Hyalomma asiaticum]|uniref:Uncharacterized protein n=1 Tax=Hyalomma asiaticum TaxID=266040 RepID=A0ACB7SNZ0_HYAAI|nr:hypothetical protein HPB50_001521 [Hyalomma asiaticum]